MAANGGDVSFDTVTSKRWSYKPSLERMKRKSFFHRVWRVPHWGKTVWLPRKQWNCEHQLSLEEKNDTENRSWRKKMTLTMAKTVQKRHKKKAQAAPENKRLNGIKFRVASHSFHALLCAIFTKKINLFHSKENNRFCSSTAELKIKVQKHVELVKVQAEFCRRITLSLGTLWRLTRRRRIHGRNWNLIASFVEWIFEFACRDKSIGSLCGAAMKRPFDWGG